MLPKLPPRTGWGFEEVARRHGDFALAAVAATLTVSGGAIAQARVALTGVGPTALRVAAVEALLVGHALEPKLTGRAVDAVRAAIGPDTDLHASADYRRHLAGVLTRRALEAAWRDYAEPDRVRLFTCDDPAVLIVATKPADDGHGIIVRVRECDGETRRAIRSGRGSVRDR